MMRESGGDAVNFSLNNCFELQTVDVSIIHRGWYISWSVLLFHCKSKGKIISKHLKYHLKSYITPFLNNRRAVSYTHLDVYKRQPLCYYLRIDNTHLKEFKSYIVTNMLLHLTSHVHSINTNNSNHTNNKLLNLDSHCKYLAHWISWIPSNKSIS